jgi:hypothetical protein
MKHKLNLILFLLPLLTFFALNIVIVPSKTVSMREKRVVSPRPDFSVRFFFSGQYSRDYDDYYADTFVFRDRLVEVGSSIKGLKGFRGVDEATLLVRKGNNMAGRLSGGEPSGDINQGAGATAGPGLGIAAVAAVAPAAGPGVLPTEQSPVAGERAAAETPASTGVGVTATPPREETTEDLRAVNYSDTYLVLRDRALQLYKYDRPSAEAYAKAINRLRALIDPKIRVYDMLVPSQIEFLGIEKYRSLSDSQKQAFSHVNRLLSKTVTPVDAYGALYAHKDEYIYLRTDHHWTSLGAYYVYREFMKTIGEEPVELGKYRKEEIKGYLGTAYAATLKSSLKNYADTLELYIPFTPHNYSIYALDGALKRDVVGNSSIYKGVPDYGVFLGGDFPWGDIKTNVRNNKRILLLKDSMGNAFVPFLLPHYEEIYYIDPRHFKANLLKFIKDKNITDLLILNGSYVTTYSGIADLLNEIMKK